MKIQVWTMQMSKWRVAQAQDIFVVNTTAKSGIQQFAPDFEYVMAYKRGDMDMVEYTRFYLARMERSREFYPRTWSSLLTRPRIALTCYCKAGVFCHRHLLKPMVGEYITAHGHEFIDEGELGTQPPALEAEIISP